MPQPAHRTILPARLQPQHPQRLRHYHPLLMVVRRRDALEGLEALERSGATRGLVGQHAADGAPEHLGRVAVVPWAAAGRVVAGLFAHEGLVLHCRISYVLVCVYCG